MKMIRVVRLVRVVDDDHLLDNVKQQEPHHQRNHDRRWIRAARLDLLDDGFGAGIDQRLGLVAGGLQPPGQEVLEGRARFGGPDGKGQSFHERSFLMRPVVVKSPPLREGGRGQRVANHELR